MNVIEFENKMKEDIESIFNDILMQHNYIFSISARARGGAEISDYLEDSFVDYLCRCNKYNNVYNPKSAPKGATKNPYDFCFNYHCNEFNFDDLVWGDIKATKHSYNDSNPDLGTPEKVIKFIKDGHFYLMYVFFEYISTDDDKTKFIPFSDGKYVHCQFLKDIHHSVRINPKPQFQVNISEPEEYRTKEEFIELFYNKYKESINRNIEKQMKKKEELDDRFNELRFIIKHYDNESE